ncbi:N-acyl-D-amino-acid deacylase [Rhodococcus spongiicola]|uniref:N-acyl-D-amino-acid deacylase n=1 Tax=Rhodococcus spongiicola TaxID=2487352 RepID=A0A438B0H0_9NOCA|nr:N-acyl-D-amino-acid deacylase [Rhodococcus spongiicola]RVW04453.1 N-acyl-D-amino-acid deacylase [Rhodococcus spongiicola]
MAEVVSIDVGKARAAVSALGASVEPLDRAAENVTRCEFGASTFAVVDPAHEQGIREGYLRLALAIGAWVPASDVAGQECGDTADVYPRQNSAAISDVVACSRR